MQLPSVATKLKSVLDGLTASELLTSAELAAHAGLTPLRGDGGYGGTLARLASVYLPDYSHKIGSTRYWGQPTTIQDLKTQLEKTSAN